MNIFILNIVIILVLLNNPIVTRIKILGNIYFGNVTPK